MKYLIFTTCLLFTGCTNGVVNSLSDVGNSIKSLTNQSIESKVLVKKANISQNCDGKSKIIKQVDLNNTIYVKESSENINWLNVYNLNNDKDKIGCIPKSATNYKEFTDSFSDLGANTLELFIKTEKEQFKSKGFTKEERVKFTSKKGFSIEEKNSRKKSFNYEYGYIYNYVNELSDIKNMNNEFALAGGLK